MSGLTALNCKLKNTQYLAKKNAVSLMRSEKNAMLTVYFPFQSLMQFREYFNILISAFILLKADKLTKIPPRGIPRPKQTQASRCRNTSAFGCFRL
jgi:hypothetical protein